MLCRSSDFGCDRFTPSCSAYWQGLGDANMSSGQGQGDVWALGGLDVCFGMIN